MGRQPVVSLEDRVPQLKERRKKRANRRLIFVVLLFVLLILIILYFQSPYSKIQTIEVEGSNLMQSNVIIDSSRINEGDSYWGTDANRAEESIMNLSEVKKAVVEKKFPTTLMIQIEEYKQVAYIRHDQQFIPLLENGASSLPVAANEISAHAPLLIGFPPEGMLENMTKQLAELPSEVQESISEIHYTPTETDQSHITAYMNDGFEVSALISTFADKMVHYPSIVSQLDPDVKGVIDLEVGSYFRAYETMGGAEEEESNEIETEG
ncbi:hypothetical protein KP78_23410 [Jeotgalibacillus soli]|uniref:Cell division protein DivIB n=2 Tax=Jeotgalibacillus soli TaxID=889306 RepID=A0A0C2V764_9BACL|nr:hypothetical protein KP78_23410 [Jeotgalibacillus soli]